MKIDKTLQEDEDIDILNGEHLIDGGYDQDEVNESFEDDYIDDVASEDVGEYEVELVVAEPTKVVDMDGSVVLVTPGDVVTVKSESMKRINKSLE